MIDRTFLHCRGVGPKTESKLKSLGFNSWEDCLLNKDLLPFKDEKLENFIENIKASKNALDSDDISFFVDSFPHREHWRILGKYFNDTTFFDIETTGISRYDNHATVIVAFYRNKIYTFVVKENLDDFLSLVDDSTLLASFNGNAFDIPFLEHTFHVPGFDCPHIDLRWVAYHVGYKTNLKSIERRLGIKRPEDLIDIDGYEAVRLYYDWTAGDKEAREKLINYCRADTLSCYTIASMILNKYGYDLIVNKNFI